ncbi:MAG: DUF177 domain-containing protein [Deferribacteraceae bacterium]|jgi:uncharacterized protein|nr:DUF177 domain-containing protein [Deferribacteraceae bacterium]
MKIIIYNEIEDSSLAIEHSFSFEDGSDRADIQFEGNLLKVDNAGFYLQGVADVIYNTICDRCGGTAVLKLRADISINIERGLPITKPVGFAADEHEMSDEDGDSFYSEPDSLDLEELLRQEVILQVPAKRICKEDCQGLEYKDSPEAEITPINSLAALKALKEK